MTQLLAGPVTRRRQIVEMMAAEGERERRAPKRLHKSIARLRKALEKELVALGAEIGDPVRGSQCAALRSGRLG